MQHRQCLDQARVDDLALWRILQAVRQALGQVEVFEHTHPEFRGQSPLVAPPDLELLLDDVSDTKALLVAQALPCARRKVPKPMLHCPVSSLVRVPPRATPTLVGSFLRRCHCYMRLGRRRLLCAARGLAGRSGCARRSLHNRLLRQRPRLCLRLRLILRCWLRALRHPKQVRSKATASNHLGRKRLHDICGLCREPRPALK